MMMPSSSQHRPLGPQGENYTDIKNLQYDHIDSSKASFGKATTPRKPLHQDVKLSDATWVVPTSTKAIRAVNPVTFAFNRLADKVKLGSQRNDGKDPISLANGDPRSASDFGPCTEAIKASVHSMMRDAQQSLGYANACGISSVRKAIAEHHSYTEHRIEAGNVIVTNGCSGALELAFNALLDPGCGVLIPQPSIPMYEMMADSVGATVIKYRLLMDSKWECDMDFLHTAMQHCGNKIRAIVVNNPSSATGAVFSQLHIVQLLEFARIYRLPIIADEVFGDMTYAPSNFFPIAQVAAQLGRQVPVITASGLSKQLLIPGWRAGWVTFHDNVYGSLRDLQAGAVRLAELGPGVSTLTQCAIPQLLSKSNAGLNDWKDRLQTSLERQIVFLMTKLSVCDGLVPMAPQGTYYTMVKIGYNVLGMDDWEFASRLLDEENLIVLPGSAIGAPNNCFRISFHLPQRSLYEATTRLYNFCQRHAAERKETLETLIDFAMI